jgi:hypothetical protein
MESAPTDSFLSFFTPKVHAIQTTQYEVKNLCGTVIVDQETVKNFAQRPILGPIGVTGTMAQCRGMAHGIPRKAIIQDSL